MLKNIKKWCKIILHHEHKILRKLWCKEDCMKEVQKTVIQGVLEEELDRNIRMKKRYMEEIEKLPKGSLLLRKIGNQEYYYLKYRENKKNIAKYIGKKDQIIIKALEEQIKKRKHLESVIKNLNKEEKEIKKALR